MKFMGWGWEQLMNAPDRIVMRIVTHTMQRKK